MNIYHGLNHLLKFIVTQKCMSLFIFIIFTKFSLAQVTDSCNCATIDFETIPGDSVYEGLIIDNQYLDSLGITFVLEDGTFPHIADVGGKTTAFESSFGGDSPAPDQNIGSFFLTDDGLTSGSGLTTSPLIINFPIPIDSASGVILDIDANESFKIQARDLDGNVIHEDTILAGDPGTGDGLATPWSIKRENADIHSIRLEGKRTQSGFFGLGFDNFTSCSSLRSTSINRSRLEDLIPENIILYNNFPNPFNPSTQIKFNIPKSSEVTLKIFTILGEEVAQIVSEKLTAGTYFYEWDASRSAGIASGVYLYRLSVKSLAGKAGEYVETRKMVLMK